MKKIIKFLSISCVMCGLMAACNDDPSPSTSSDCDAATFSPSCVDAKNINACVDGKVVSNSCGDGKKCEKNSCVDETPISTTECTKSEECGSGKVCENNKCVADTTVKTGECTKSEECGSGKVCENNKCVADTTVKTGECTKSEECGSGKVCENNKCVEETVSTSECDDSKPCETGKMCKDGACVTYYAATTEACEVGSSVCKDDNIVKICLNDVYYEVYCQTGCNKTENRCASDSGTSSGTDVQITTETGECTIGDNAYCDGDVVVSCVDGYLYDDNLNPLGKLIKTHCAEGYACSDGACTPKDDSCVASSCKDKKTLSKCESGKSVDVACGSDELCVSDACVAYTGVTTCKDSTECGADETCKDSLCYKNSNLALKVGDACDWNEFQEYCDGDVEIKCGDEDYNAVVYANNCSEYNGCSVTVKEAFSFSGHSNEAVMNAICRGTTADLANCTKAGVISNECVNIEDDYFPGYYSYTNACEVGTDGRMIYIAQRDETKCDSTCNESTGLCD